MKKFSPRSKFLFFRGISSKEGKLEMEENQFIISRILSLLVVIGTTCIDFLVGSELLSVSVFGTLPSCLPDVVAAVVPVLPVSISAHFVVPVLGIDTTGPGPYSCSSLQFEECRHRQGTQYGKKHRHN